MGAKYQTPEMVENAVEDALRSVKKRGLRIEDDALDELKELVDQGYRELANSRVLDLQGAEKSRAIDRAKASLDEFLAVWARVDPLAEDKVLSLLGFRTAQSEYCPVYPFT
jgi:hypothetical protein